ncbi:hypothetical protein [uncultured Peptoniphilus sp.]|uniref:hypothetical protein n=1 Tax=uncultured Peptoniphilus sp. TaxID=254354 RepID=UPI0028065B2C|nr:hypothetical protein [uncultured Peptoniphilus sp.]
MLLIIICVIVCVFAYFIIKKNTEDKRIDAYESLEESQEKMNFKDKRDIDWKEAEDLKTNNLDKTVLAHENSKIEEEKIEDKNINSDSDGEILKSSEDESLKEKFVTNTPEEGEKKAKESSPKDKKNKENNDEQINDQEGQKAEEKLDYSEIKEKKKEGQKLEDKKIEAREEISQASKSINSLDDYLNSLEDPQRLKELSPKLIYRSKFNKDDDFHKTILNGLGSEEKEKLEAKDGEYNLYDIIDFMKNTEVKPTVINKKKLLNLQYITKDRKELEKFLDENKLSEFKDKIDDNSNLTATINIDKEERKISEVTELINLSAANYISLTKTY